MTIEVEQLSKRYGRTAAIEEVTFTVEAGEILGFLGPNGAGKTTTMRIVSGYIPASSGTARVAGYDVHEQSMAVRQRIGYLPESPPLYPDMSVEGYLFFVARIKGVPSGDRAQRVDWALKRCYLDDRRYDLIRKLSKGYRQRVGIAQAIVHDPPAIILDEPTVGLDPRQIIEVRNLIKSLAGEHTIVLSTHILPEVSMTCDRVAIIASGKVVATNTPDRLLADLGRGLSYEIEVGGGDPYALQMTLKELACVSSVGVSSVASPPNLPRSLLKVACDADAEPGGEIAAAIVGAGLKLYEMRRTRPSLEDVFLELTTRESGISVEEDNSLGNREEESPSSPEMPTGEAETEESESESEHFQD